MTVVPRGEPAGDIGSRPTVELALEGQPRDLGGGFSVRRVLPAIARRMVGPFAFFDHMGPVALEPGRGMDVRPHPHINLATVTYLFDGEILHRDSLGTEQPIQPGAVNWMTAGRGITHSERSTAAARKAGARVHGLQLWVALPKAEEEVEPSFQHVRQDAVPTVDLPGARARVIAGAVYGVASPVRVSSPLFYVEAQLEPGATLALPDGHAERAVYVVEGAVICDDDVPYRAGTMLVIRAGSRAEVRALEGARLMLLGGAPLDGERYIWWNFVSSSPERIEVAKREWRERRFARIPGDDDERIPLPG